MALKNIYDFRMKPCYVDIPNHLEHKNNLLSEMLDHCLNSSKTHKKMKQYFLESSICCIKKTLQSNLSQEYYLHKTNHSLDYILNCIDPGFQYDLSEFNFPALSIEFTQEKIEINLFQSNFSYTIHEGFPKKKNVYSYFKVSDIDLIRKKIEDSIFSYKIQDLNFILSWLGFQRSDGIVYIANKKASDAIYLSRVSFRGFLEFIKEFGWQPYLGNYVIANKKFLKYYVFDISIEYSYDNGNMLILKTGIYGLV